MAVTNEVKIKLTVDIFDHLHDKVYVALSKNSKQDGYVSHLEHGKLMLEVIENLHEWFNRKTTT